MELHSGFSHLNHGGTSENENRSTLTEDSETSSSPDFSPASGSGSMEHMLTSYPGGKNSQGTFQQIINRIPLHTTRGELCLGSGAISRHIRPVPLLIVNDTAEEVLKPWRGKDGVIVMNKDVLDLLLEFLEYGSSTFLYLDPPYPFPVRRSSRRIYKREWGELEHQIFLSRVLLLKCRVMISSYRNSVYDDALKGWTLYEFKAGTRGGSATEALYMNYNPDECILHDYRYYGRNWKHREHVRLKVKRFKSKLNQLPLQERYAIVASILTDYKELAGGFIREGFHSLQNEKK